MDKIIIYNLNNFGLLDKGYELYLREFINNSSYFVNNYGNFFAPETECHGEDDANSESGYSIDFKRFISQDECRYRRKHSIPDRYIIRENDTFNRTHGHFDMFRCMKNLTLEDFEKIKKHKYNFKNKLYQKEIENMTQRLLTKHKNIMLYMPKIIESNDIRGTIEFINRSLDSMLRFRKKYVNKDLYFSFIITNNVKKKNTYKCIVLKYMDNRLAFVDCINTGCSQYFKKER